MPIDFSDSKNRFSYTTRDVDSSWYELMKPIADWDDKIVADIGCGGGIYSKAILKLGAKAVMGIDSSAEMLQGAKQIHSDDNIAYRLGDACQTGLPDGESDMVFERALIHHLTQLEPCFAEAKRILKPGGHFIIQDRTPEDCFLPGRPTYLRGYLFEKYPKLIPIESNRRHADEKIKETFVSTGFENITSYPLWEVRNVYPTFAQLKDDLQDRVGRSILHDLTDEELMELISYIEQQIATAQETPIIEQDRWTVWVSQKP